MNFNNKLRLALEHVAPGIDHHLEHGVTGDSYAEIADSINKQHAPRLKALTKQLEDYLQHTGYTPGEDPERQPDEQKFLEIVERIPGYAHDILDTLPHWPDLLKGQDRSMAYRRFRVLVTTVLTAAPKTRRDGQYAAQVAPGYNHPKLTTLLNHIVRTINDIQDDTQELAKWFGERDHTDDDLEFKADDEFDYTPDGINKLRFALRIPDMSPAKLHYLKTIRPQLSMSMAPELIGHITYSREYGLAPAGIDPDQAQEALIYILKHWPITQEQLLQACDLHDFDITNAIDYMSQELEPYLVGPIENYHRED